MQSPLGNDGGKALKDLRKDTSGLALIYVTALLPVIIGFSLLAIDVGRLSTLNSTLQHGADALALAGAGELDRRTDAITRADRAIANLITTNKSLFGASVVTIDENAVTVRYLSAIPGHGLGGTDADPMPAGAGLIAANASDNQSARFVEVRVTPVSFNTIFPVSFLGGGGSGSTQTAASAVAGFDAAVCNFTPMFICNPYEPAGNTDVLRNSELVTAVSTTAGKRKLIQMKRHDSGQWSPGNYGYLESPLGPGANALRDMIGTASPPACFLQNAIYTKPGNVTSANAAWNVRFDIYSGPMNNAKNDPQFRPARNVRRGFIPPTGGGGGAACNAVAAVEPNANYEKLNRDSCFATSTCPVGSDRIGDGNWDFDTYWQQNFRTTAKPRDASGAVYSNTNRPTRYDIYRYEIDNSLIATKSGSPTALSNGETGTPACYNAGSAAGATPVSDTPDRRIFYGAIMNCIAQPIASGSSGGPYTAAAFGQFFMTEPMGGAQDSLWSELVSIVQPGTANSVARDMVQLYR